ncbi:hypothetical protein PUNSTDRAFT_137065 [Punctularia strigosozonata HHB-11173 SS5]|uniref:uncharacterized protein n=1 Tax=Punctularia strigosozonata (strain HHB-11173) TaxID=741275 RepID=UPI00044162F8|nr:uncharacterized protein PUNSTDRAFT_137065 [Punctularia strigosozonata HHB-11173 SS5]EIN06283.1 hypothetical protein PUNSTDRAFT_137065 [Punctularia strigosozonata HHB-11173 SS5]
MATFSPHIGSIGDPASSDATSHIRMPSVGTGSKDSVRHGFERLNKLRTRNKLLVLHTDGEAFHRQEYALTRPFNYRWPYATCFLVIFGLGSILGFAIINHILLGYDVVAISSRDFNVSQNLPWPASFHARDYSCQPAHFQLGNAFRTNNSAFTYSIFNVYSGTSLDTQGSFVYSNNLLSNCDVSEIQTNTLPAERSITITGSIRCPEQGFQASTSYTYTNHDIIGNSVQTSFSNNSMTRAIASAMADAGDDAYLAIYKSAYTFRQGNKVYRYTRQYATNCDASVSDAKTTEFAACDQQPADLTMTWDNVIGLTDLEIYPSSLLDNYTWIRSTLDNLAQTFYAGVRLDLGHWTPNNIFTNFTSLNTTGRILGRPLSDQESEDSSVVLNGSSQRIASAASSVQVAGA